MTRHTERHTADHANQSRRATSGRPGLRERLAAHGIRLPCPSRRRKGQSTSRPTSNLPAVLSQVRERVLRDYHAANLVHARHGAEELVRAGFNTGAVPFGYRAQRIRVCPPGRRPRWRTRLMIEPVEAAVVKMIFAWRVADRLTIAEIVQHLSDARYPAPLDPETGQPGVWAQTGVQAILRNPKYTGRQVWGRRHHGQPAPATRWVWSPAWAHPPLITIEEFTAANRPSRLIATPPTHNHGQTPEPGQAA